MPHERQSSASAYSSAKSAGCVYAVWSSRRICAPTADTGPRASGRSRCARQELRATVERAAERRLRVVERRGPCRRTGALPGEQERDVRTIDRLRLALRTPPVVRRQPPPAWRRAPRGRVSDHREAMGEVCAARVGACSRYRQRHVAAARESDRCVTRRQAPQRGVRSWPTAPAGAAAAPGPDCGRQRAAPPPDDHVRIRAAEPERADAGERGRPRGRPRRGRVPTADRRVAPAGCAGSARSKCRCGGICSVLQREHHLDQAGDARPPPPGGRCWSSPSRSHSRCVGCAAVAEHRAAAPRTSIGSPSDVPVPCAST